MTQTKKPELKKMFLARLNGEGGKIFLEADGKTVTQSLERIADGEVLNLEYWFIKDGVNVSLNPVSLKNAARVAAPAREIAIIEAGGEDVGSGEVDV